MVGCVHVPRHIERMIHAAGQGTKGCHAVLRSMSLERERIADSERQIFGSNLEHISDDHFGGLAVVAGV